MPNVSFGTYEAPEKNENVTKVTLGVFFDGTLNNKRNTYIRKEKEKKAKGIAYDEQAVKDDPWGWDKDSYLNDYSNVARMVDFYTLGVGLALYVEGIGTLNGETDTVAGYVTGKGATGIRAKVRLGCQKVAEKIPAGGTVELVVDVFGFSRGAAAARAFVNEITKGGYPARLYSDGEAGSYHYADHDGFETSKKSLPPRGHLGNLLEDKSATIKSLEVRFLGLYDTVSSYGLNFNDDTTAASDVADLNLAAVGHPAVKYVTQLAAGHEWRKNFSLTSIESAATNKSLEVTLPGAHADVGGCYEDGTFTQEHKVPLDDEDKQTVYRYGWASRQFAPAKEKNKQPLVDSGWYKPAQLEFKGLDGNYSAIYKGTRFVDKRYSYIPLHFMCKLATDKQASFKMDQLGNEKNFNIPENTPNGKHILGYTKSRLESFINGVKSTAPGNRAGLTYKNYLDWENEKILINGFIHWSATGKIGHGERAGGERKIIPVKYDES